jgi:hypothetical protein
MIAKALFSAFLAIILSTSVATESPGQGTVTERPRSATRQEGVVRVQMSIQLFLTGPTDDSEAAEQQRERARRTLYNVASKECDVLRETIARDCLLQTININLNRHGNVQMPGYSVTGSMGFQVTLK